MRDERLDRRVEGATEGPLGEGVGEGLQPFGPVRGIGLHAGQLPGPLTDRRRALDGRRLDRLQPFLRDGAAALVADAAIVRGEGSRDDKRRRRVLGDQVPRGHPLDRPVRLPPEELDRGPPRLLVDRVVDPLAGLRELQPQWMGPSGEEVDRATVLGVVARLHPGVDERRAVPVGMVDQQPDGLLGADDELMHPRLHRHDRALPADRKPARLEALRIGPLDAEVEADRGIEPLEDPAGGVEVAPLEIFPPQPPLRSRARRGGKKPGDEIGDRLLVLADGEPGKFDPGRSMAVTGQRRIEAAMNPLCHRGCRLAGDGGRVVLRHGIGDIPGQLPDGAVTDQRSRGCRRADTVVAVAAEAVLAVDRRAGVILGHGRTHR